MQLLHLLQGSVMVWMAAHAPDAAMAAAVTATAALWWPDEAMANAAAFCRCAALPGRHAPYAGQELMRFVKNADGACKRTHAFMPANAWLSICAGCTVYAPGDNAAAIHAVHGLLDCV